MDFKKDFQLWNSQESTIGRISELDLIRRFFYVYLNINICEVYSYGFEIIIMEPGQMIPWLSVYLGFPVWFSPAFAPSWHNFLIQLFMYLILRKQASCNAKHWPLIISLFARLLVLLHMGCILRKQKWVLVIPAYYFIGNLPPVQETKRQL